MILAQVRALAAVLMMLACAPRQARAEVKYLHFGLEDRNVTVTLNRGDTLSLGFYSLLSTGYSWTKREEQHVVLNFTGYNRQEAPPDNFMWNATAIHTGLDHLTFACGTPWSGVAQTVNLEIVCK